jgi:uncharacterized protein YndB with AHSA1/START domain
MARAPLIFTYYIAAPVEKVWDGFVSKEANQKIFIGADFQVDLKPGGAMTWSGPGKDGKPMRYVTGEVLRVEAPTLLEYKFGMGDGAMMSRVKVELTPETEAVKVVVTNDGWTEDDPAYAQNADGWPRILSRLKTLLETGENVPAALDAQDKGAQQCSNASSIAEVKRNFLHCWHLVEADSLFEEQVSDRRFEIPVDYRNCSQIEGGMRTHQHPDLSSDCEYRPEYQTDDGSLLHTSQPLVEVMD